MVIFLKTLRIREKLGGQTAKREPPPAVRAGLLHAAALSAGFLLGSVRVLSTLSPFGVALVTALPEPYILTAGLGAAAGCMLTQDSVGSLRCIAALICAGVLASLFGEFERLRRFRRLPALAGFLSCFLSGLSVMFAAGFDASLFLLCLCEGFAAFAASCFLSAFLGFCVGGRRSGLELRTLLPVLAAAFLLLLSIRRAALFGVSLSGICACLLIELCAVLYKEAGGAVCGGLAAAVFALSDEVGAAGLIYAVSGLIAGAFAYSGHRLTSAMFGFSFCAAWLLAGGGAQRGFLLAEAAIAVVLLLALPKKRLLLLESRLLPKNDAADCSAGRQAVFERLRAAVNAVDEIDRSVSAVSNTLLKAGKGGENTVFLHTQEAVCRTCGRYDYCWNANSEDTLRAFGEMRELLRRNVPVGTANAPGALASRCIRLTSLTESFNKNYLAFTARQAAERRVAEIRAVTADQFGGIRDMLSELTGEFERKVEFDTVLAGRLRDVLESELRLPVRSVSCRRGENGRILAEITFSSVPQALNLGLLRDRLSELCGRPFDLPAVSGERALSFCERTPYTVESAAAQLPADEEKLCGDCYESFFDGRGNYVVILSDGMGTGPRAAVDSALASGLMGKLVRAGFGFASALRLVNAALILKSRDESLATLDILRLDLFTGKAVFCKAGAALSVIKRKDRLFDIKKAALPAGILRDAVFASCEGELQAGDLVVMATDGAFDYSGGALRGELARLRDEDPKTAARRLARRAKEAKNGRRCDDITVIALKIKKRPS